MQRSRPHCGSRRRIRWLRTISTCRAETVSPRIQSGAGCHRGVNLGLRLTQEMFRGEIDPPAGQGMAVRRTRPRGDTVQPRRDRLAKPKPAASSRRTRSSDQPFSPKLRRTAGSAMPTAVVGDDDGEAGLAGRLIGERADGDPHPRGVGTTAVLQRLGHDIRKRAGVNPRDPPDGAVMDAGADRPGGRTGNLGHAWTSVRGVETEPPRPACPGP